MLRHLGHLVATGVLGLVVAAVRPERLPLR
jgi:hypothetical protein